MGSGSCIAWPKGQVRTLRDERQIRAAAGRGTRNLVQRADRRKHAFRFRSQPADRYMAGFVSDAAIAEDRLARREASDADIDELARPVVEVICNASDQEGYVIWRRGSVSSA